MASKSKSIYCPNYSSSLPFTLSVSFSESSYSVTDNTSTISLSASIKSGGVSFDTNYNNTLQIYWYDNNASSSGSLVSTKNVQDLSKNATASLSNVTFTVKHKADGTLSGYAKAVWTKHSSNSSVGYVPSSGNVSTSNTALTTIPRTSSMSLSASSCYAGNNITINIARASTSFTHSIHYNINGGSWVHITTGVGDSYTWAVPMSLITTTGNISATINVLVETFSGSTYIGGTSSSFILTPYGASTISSVSGSTIGGDMTINIARNHTSFTHTVFYYYGNASGTIATGVGTSTIWKSIPMELCSQTPSATSGWGYLYIDTYYGSTQIGSRQSKSLYLEVPSSVVPTCSDITLTRIDNGVPSSWGVYVQGYSQAKASVSGSGSYGSSITGSYIYAQKDNKTINSTSNGSLTINLLNSGDYSFSAQTIDSRSRVSVVKYAYITVYDYSKPSISVTAKRCTSDGTADSSGTYLKVTCEYGYASVGGNNSASVNVSCNGVSNSSFISGTSFVLNANCSISSMYTVTASITDGLGNTSTATALIPTAERIMNVSESGKGIAFGGFSTNDNELQIYKDLLVTKNTWIDGTLRVSGALILGKYLDDSHYVDGGIRIHDLRNVNQIPSMFGACTMNTFFCNLQNRWNSVLHMRGWTGSDYASHQLYFNAGDMNDQNLYHRCGTNDYGWGSIHALLDTNNYKNYCVATTGAVMTGTLDIRGGSLSMSGGSIYASSGYHYFGSIGLRDAWMGFYSSYEGCFQDKNRKGWMGHNGSINFSICNEAGGIIVLSTASKNVYVESDGTYIGLQTSDNWLRCPSSGLLPFSSNNGNSNSCLGSSYWYFSYGYIYNMYASGYNSSSDRKLKDSIKEINKAKEFILNLKPCEYIFKDGDSKGERRHMGFIAQEVSQLANELEMGNMAIYSASVNTGEKDENGMQIEGYYDENIDDEKLSWSLRYNEFIAPMVVTIQEQQKQIDELQKQINELKA